MNEALRTCALWLIRLTKLAVLGWLVVLAWAVAQGSSMAIFAGLGLIVCAGLLVTQYTIRDHLLPKG